MSYNAFDDIIDINPLHNQNKFYIDHLKINGPSIRMIKEKISEKKNRKKNTTSSISQNPFYMVKDIIINSISTSIRNFEIVFPEVCISQNGTVAFSSQIQRNSYENLIQYDNYFVSMNYIGSEHKKVNLRSIKRIFDYNSQVIDNISYIKKNIELKIDTFSSDKYKKLMFSYKQSSFFQIYFEKFRFKKKNVSTSSMNKIFSFLKMNNNKSFRIIQFISIKSKKRLIFFQVFVNISDDQSKQGESKEINNNQYNSSKKTRKTRKTLSKIPILIGERSIKKIKQYFPTQILGLYIKHNLINENEILLTYKKNSAIKKFMEELDVPTVTKLNNAMEGNQYNPYIESNIKKNLFKSNQKNKENIEKSEKESILIRNKFIMKNVRLLYYPNSTPIRYSYIKNKSLIKIIKLTESRLTDISTFEHFDFPIKFHVFNTIFNFDLFYDEKDVKKMYLNIVNQRSLSNLHMKSVYKILDFLQVKPSLDDNEFNLKMKLYFHKMISHNYIYPSKLTNTILHNYIVVYALENTSNLKMKIIKNQIKSRSASASSKKMNFDFKGSSILNTLKNNLVIKYENKSNSKRMIESKENPYGNNSNNSNHDENHNKSNINLINPKPFCVYLRKPQKYNEIPIKSYEKILVYYNFFEEIDFNHLDLNIIIVGMGSYDYIKKKFSFNSNQYIRKNKKYVTNHDKTLSKKSLNQIEKYYKTEYDTNSISHNNSYNKSLHEKILKSDLVVRYKSEISEEIDKQSLLIKLFSYQTNQIDEVSHVSHVNNEKKNKENQPFLKQNFNSNNTYFNLINNSFSFIKSNKQKYDCSINDFNQYTSILLMKKLKITLKNQTKPSVFLKTSFSLMKILGFIQKSYFDYVSFMTKDNKKCCFHSKNHRSNAKSDKNKEGNNSINLSLIMNSNNKSLFFNNEDSLLNHIKERSVDDIKLENNDKDNQIYKVIPFNNWNEKFNYSKNLNSCIGIMNNFNYLLKKMEDRQEDKESLIKQKEKENEKEKEKEKKKNLVTTVNNDLSKEKSLIIEEKLNSQVGNISKISNVSNVSKVSKDKEKPKEYDIEYKLLESSKDIIKQRYYISNQINFKNNQNFNIKLYFYRKIYKKTSFSILNTKEILYNNVFLSKNDERIKFNLVLFNNLVLSKRRFGLIRLFDFLIHTDSSKVEKKDVYYKYYKYLRIRIVKRQEKDEDLHVRLMRKYKKTTFSDEENEEKVSNKHISIEKPKIKPSLIGNKAYNTKIIISNPDEQEGKIKEINKNYIKPIEKLSNKVFLSKFSYKKVMNFLKININECKSMHISIRKHKENNPNHKKIFAYGFYRNFRRIYKEISFKLQKNNEKDEENTNKLIKIDNETYKNLHLKEIISCNNKNNQLIIIKAKPKNKIIDIIGYVSLYKILFLYLNFKKNEEILSFVHLKKKEIGLNFLSQLKHTRKFIDTDRNIRNISQESSSSEEILKINKNYINNQIHFNECEFKGITNKITITNMTNILKFNNIKYTFMIRKEYKSVGFLINISQPNQKSIVTYKKIQSNSSIIKRHLLLFLLSKSVFIVNDKHNLNVSYKTHPKNLKIFDYLKKSYFYSINPYIDSIFYIKIGNSHRHSSSYNGHNANIRNILFLLNSNTSNKIDYIRRFNYEKSKDGFGIFSETMRKSRVFLKRKEKEKENTIKPQYDLYKTEKKEVKIRKVLYSFNKIKNFISGDNFYTTVSISDSLFINKYVLFRKEKKFTLKTSFDSLISKKNHEKDRENQSFEYFQLKNREEIIKILSLSYVLKLSNKPKKHYIGLSFIKVFDFISNQTELMKNRENNSRNQENLKEKSVIDYEVFTKYIKFTFYDEIDVDESIKQMVINKNIKSNLLLKKNFYVKLKEVNRNRIERNAVGNEEDEVLILIDKTDEYVDEKVGSYIDVDEVIENDKEIDENEEEKNKETIIKSPSLNKLNNKENPLSKEDKNKELNKKIYIRNPNNNIIDDDFIEKQNEILKLIKTNEENNPIEIRNKTKIDENKSLLNDLNKNKIEISKGNENIIDSFNKDNISSPTHEDEHKNKENPSNSEEKNQKNEKNNEKNNENVQKDPNNTIINDDYINNKPIEIHNKTKIDENKSLLNDLNEDDKKMISKTDENNINNTDENLTKFNENNKNIIDSINKDNTPSPTHEEDHKNKENPSNFKELNKKIYIRNPNNNIIDDDFIEKQNEILKLIKTNEENNPIEIRNKTKIDENSIINDKNEGNQNEKSKTETENQKLLEDNQNNKENQEKLSDKEEKEKTINDIIQSEKEEKEEKITINHSKINEKESKIIKIKNFLCLNRELYKEINLNLNKQDNKENNVTNSNNIFMLDCHQHKTQLELRKSNYNLLVKNKEFMKKNEESFLINELINTRITVRNSKFKRIAQQSLAQSQAQYSNLYTKEILYNTSKYNRILSEFKLKSIVNIYKNIEITRNFMNFHSNLSLKRRIFNRINLYISKYGLISKEVKNKINKKEKNKLNSQVKTMISMRKLIKSVVFHIKTEENTEKLENHKQILQFQPISDRNLLLTLLLKSNKPSSTIKIFDLINKSNKSNEFTPFLKVIPYKKHDYTENKRDSMLIRLNRHKNFQEFNENSIKKTTLNTLFSSVKYNFNNFYSNLIENSSISQLEIGRIGSINKNPMKISQVLLDNIHDKEQSKRIRRIIELYKKPYEFKSLKEEITNFLNQEKRKINKVQGNNQENNDYNQLSKLGELLLSSYDGNDFDFKVEVDLEFISKKYNLDNKTNLKKLILSKVVSFDFVHNINYLKNENKRLEVIKTSLFNENNERFNRKNLDFIRDFLIFSCFVVVFLVFMSIYNKDY